MIADPMIARVRWLVVRRPPTVVIDAAAWDRVGRDLVRAGLAPGGLDVKGAYTREFPSGVAP